MKSKLMLTTAALLLITQFNYDAAELYGNDGSVVTDGSQICANAEYTFETTSNNNVEANIVSTKDSTLLATANAKNGSVELMFPSNIKDLSVYFYEYTNDDRELLDSVNVTVSDCGYEVVTDDYKSSKPKASFELTDTGITFTMPELTDYKLYVNSLDKDDDGKAAPVHFKDGTGSIETTSDVIQVTEQYVNDDGKDVERYFEIDTSDDIIIIRHLSNLDLQLIKPLEYIDKKTLVYVFLGLIAFVFLYILYLITKKQYNAKKRYKRKIKELKVKKQQEVEEQRKRKLREKKRLLEEQEKKKRDSEHRANLEIRK